MLCITTGARAQNLPSNTCGIIYSYDLSGNRIGRQYVCNNSSMMDTKQQNLTFNTILPSNTKLYPNPTTGQFSISFTKALDNAEITVTDMLGKTIIHTYKSGTYISMDLSNVTSGMYLVNIQDKDNPIHLKVIKAK
ncbi:T9SS type A sorting domain-containing protein [Rhizosphaericola mali]|nr:T9SS type A sorting domain-containing protein [Rhizosphaericola mali]